MNKWISILFLIFISAVEMTAQNSPNMWIGGTVYFQAGIPVTNQIVHISADSTDGFIFEQDLITNGDGVFSIIIPNGSLSGETVNYYVSTIDNCSGEVLLEELSSNDGSVDVAQLVFTVCVPVVLPGCSVQIEYNQQDSLYFAVASANDPIFYQWNTGANNSFIEHSVVPMDEYCVTIIDASGCYASDCIQVAAPPAGCQTAIVEDENNNGEDILVAVSSGTGPYEYQWNTGQFYPTIYPINEGEYCVTTTDITGCKSVFCIDYEFDSCAVSIFKDPITGGYTANVYGEGILEYDWSTNDFAPVVFPNDNFIGQNVCVTVLDQNYCFASSCVYMDQSIISGSAECYSYIVEDYGDKLVANCGDPDNSEFIWSTGSQSAFIYPNDAGLYCVTVTDPYGCQSLDCYYFSLDEINNNSDGDCNAGYYLYYSEDTEGELFLVNTVTEGDNNFVWNWGDGNVSTGFFPENTYDDFGSYVVCMTVFDNNSSCVSTYCDSLGLDSLGNLLGKTGGFKVNVVSPSDPLFSPTAVTQSLDSKNSLKVYPNPASDITRVYIASKNDTPVEYSLVDIAGRIIEQKRVIPSNGKTEIIVKTKEFPSGLYFININTELINERLKLIITH